MAITSAFQADDVGSIPITRSNYGVLAQLGEHLPYKEGVSGSSPLYSTIIFAGLAQLVEHLTCNQRVEGSNPLAGTSTYRGIEQSGSSSGS